MMATEGRVHLSMPCDIETRRRDPVRRAAWHADCPDPVECGCPGHRRDATDSADTAADPGPVDRSRR